MKKFYAESPIITVHTLDCSDILTVSGGDDNVKAGYWDGWFGVSGGEQQ